MNINSENLEVAIPIGHLFKNHKFDCVSDGYYVHAVKKHGIFAGGYNKNSVRDVAEYYIKHKVAFEEVRQEMSSCGIVYPQMKLMDMCMWQARVEEE